MARDDSLEGLSCTLCLKADEPGEMLIVPIRRAFSELDTRLPFCADCIDAIMTALKSLHPEPTEEKPDEPVSES